MPTNMRGISLAGNNKVCEIRFDTTRYPSDDRLIRKAKRKISDKGINVELDTSSFADGVLVLVIGKMVDTTYAVRDFLLYMISLFTRSSRL